MPSSNAPGLINTHTWYVSYELKNWSDGPKHYARATKTFQSEVEAKIFAAQVLAEGCHPSAGTLNPHDPRKIVPPLQVKEWLECV